MSMTKLVVPAGAFDHCSAGEVLSPTQLGLPLMLPAFFFASMVPSLNDGDEIVNGSAACAARHELKTAAPARAKTFKQDIRSSSVFPDLKSN